MYNMYDLIEYRKLLDIAERFDTIDEIAELQKHEECPYNEVKLCKVCLSDKMDSRDNYIITEYFKKMNKLIK